MYAQRLKTMADSLAAQHNCAQPLRRRGGRPASPGAGSAATRGWACSAYAGCHSGNRARAAVAPPDGEQRAHVDEVVL